MIRALVLLLAVPVFIYSQGQLTDYRNAEQFLPGNIDKFAPHLYLKANWIEKSDKFWFTEKTGSEIIYKIADPLKNRVFEAFNKKKMAKALSILLKSEIKSETINPGNPEFSSGLDSVKFTINRKRIRCDLKNYRCTLIKKKNRNNHTESPDGKWKVIVKDHNIFLKEISTGKTSRITRDGEKNFSYGTAPANSWEILNKKKPWLYIYWSPDSKKFATARFDYRKCGIHHMVKTPSPASARPELISFPYSLPVDKNLPEAELLLYNISKKKLFRDPAHKIVITWYFKSLNWYKDSRAFYFNHSSRGFKKLSLQEMSAETGRIRTIVEEESKNGPVDPTIQTIRSINDGAEFIWSSERSGWNHLYLYDGKTGKLKNQITKGDYFVRSLNHIDTKRRVLFYMASGKEEGVNPYYRNLYRVTFDGSSDKRLTKENCEHSVSVSPSGVYFIDTVSRHNMAPVSILKKSSNGSNLRIIKRGDIKRLLATGWKYPEEFKVKAADSKTDIYGLIYKPRNFNPSKKYPVIDKIYTGPHNFFTPKSFRAYRSEAWSFAELGFVVVELDGRGTGKRSKDFHNFSYRNLASGSVDHVNAIKKLASTRKWMDTDRVGIYGFSAGGYDTACAMFKYPDFFKVGIAASGNHDHRMDKVWWNELWMGYPVKDHYREQSNITNAHKLKGKLLIVHGEMDTNVHPTSSLALADALIKANKDFDLLIIPGGGHYLQDESPYYVRKRWDYFVKHLLGVTPPKEYKINR